MDHVRQSKSYFKGFLSRPRVDENKVIDIRVSAVVAGAMVTRGKNATFNVPVLPRDRSGPHVNIWCGEPTEKSVGSFLLCPRTR